MTEPLTELQRANAILRERHSAGDFAVAFWAGSNAALHQTHGYHENPFSETAEPVKWAAWVRGYWNGLDTRMVQPRGRVS